MDNVVVYEHILKGMTSPDQTIVTNFAYWDGRIWNDVYLNVQLPGGPEVTLTRENIKAYYIKTVPIFKLLYL